MLLHVPGCISAPASAITMAPRKSMEDWVYLSRASKEVCCPCVPALCNKARFV